MPIPSTPSPLASILAAKTYNAAWFSGSTNEAKISNAIAKAATDGAVAVLVPANLQPVIVANVIYNPTIAVYYEALNKVSTDRGDNSITLTVGTDVRIQRFATALTANQTITLATGHQGAEFRIVRSGLGAFTLDVGGLKTLPAGTAAFADVAHDGTAWRLTGYGTL